MQRVNGMVAYLRWVHCYCFYCAREYRGMDELMQQCGMVHRRRGKAVEGDAAELEAMERRVEERVNGKGGVKDVDAAAMVEVKEAMLRVHVEMRSEGKWRCALCGKLFKGEDYVMKHVVGKHEGELKEEEVKEEWKWRRYREDEHAPVEEWGDRGGGGGGGKAGGGGRVEGGYSGPPVVGFPFRPGQPLSSMTTMPFVPALHADEERRRAAGMLIDGPPPVYSLPPISITPSSMAHPSGSLLPSGPPVSASLPPSTSLRGLTSYADLDVPDAPPPLPSHGLLLTPADGAVKHYGSVKGKWKPKGKKGKEGEDGGGVVEGNEEEKAGNASIVVE